MENNHPIYLETNLFGQPLLWFQRFLEAAIACFFVYWIDLQEIDQGSDIFWLAYLFSAIVVLCILLRPQEDLVCTDQDLIYLRRSIVPFFNSTKSYKLSSIDNIKCSGTFAQQVPGLSVFPISLSRTKLVIFFKDSPHISHNLGINKKVVERFVSELNEKIRLN